MFLKNLINREKLKINGNNEITWRGLKCLMCMVLRKKKFQINIYLSSLNKRTNK